MEKYISTKNTHTRKLDKDVSGKRTNNFNSDLHVNHRLIAYTGPTQIVYEGSEVLLEGSCNLDHGKIVNRNILYSWSLDPVGSNSNSSSNGSSSSDDHNKLQIKLQSVEANPRNTTFMAPYVYFDPTKSDNKTYVSLLFKLVARLSSQAQ